MSRLRKHYTYLPSDKYVGIRKKTKPQYSSKLFSFIKIFWVACENSGNSLSIPITALLNATFHFTMWTGTPHLCETGYQCTKCTSVQYRKPTLMKGISTWTKAQSLQTKIFPKSFNTKHEHQELCKIKNCVTIRLLFTLFWNRKAVLNMKMDGKVDSRCQPSFFQCWQ